MPRPLLSAFAAVVALLSGCTGSADWTLTEEGPAPRANLADSTDVGTWALRNEGLPAGARVSSIAHIDGAVFAIAHGATGESNVFSLQRDSSTWTNVSPERFAATEQFVALSVIGTTLYLTSADEAQNRGALYTLRFSDDPWKRLESAPDLPMSAITRKEGRLLVAVHGSPSTAGLYGSSDGGDTWIQLTDATGEAAFLGRPLRLFANSAGAQRFFATGETASGFGGLYASDDGGFTWKKSPVSGDVVDVRAANEFVLVCTTGDGELRSDNYGNTFKPMSVGAKAQSFFLSGSRAFAGTSDGVRVSADGGATWSDASDGLPSFVQVHSLYLAGGALVAAAQADVFVAELQ